MNTSHPPKSQPPTTQQTGWQEPDDFILQVQGYGLGEIVDPNGARYNAPVTVEGIRLDTKEPVCVGLQPSHPYHGRTVEALLNNTVDSGVEPGGLLMVSGARLGTPVTNSKGETVQGWKARWLTVLSWNADQSGVVRGMVTCAQGIDTKNQPWASALFLIENISQIEKLPSKIVRALQPQLIAPRQLQGIDAIREGIVQNLSARWNAHLRFIDEEKGLMDVHNIYTWQTDNQARQLTPEQAADEFMRWNLPASMAGRLEKIKVEILPSRRVFFARRIADTANRGIGRLPDSLNRYDMQRGTGHMGAFIPSLLTLRAFDNPDSRDPNHWDVYATDVYPLLWGKQRCCARDMTEAVMQARTAQCKPTPSENAFLFTSQLRDKWLKRLPLPVSVKLPDLNGLKD